MKSRHTVDLGILFISSVVEIRAVIKMSSYLVKLLCFLVQIVEQLRVIFCHDELQGPRRAACWGDRPEQERTWAASMNSKGFALVGQAYMVDTKSCAFGGRDHAYR